MSLLLLWAFASLTPSTTQGLEQKNLEQKALKLLTLRGIQNPVEYFSRSFFQKYLAAADVWLYSIKLCINNMS